jgi:hypothetical protein
MNIEEELEEVLGYGNPDPVHQTHELTEAGKSSGDYKKTTKGHKTEDPGKNMVVKGTSLSTKGSLPATKGTDNASDDYTKTTAGHKTKDPQGPDNDQVALEESEEITEESLDEILKELEDSVSGMQAESNPMENMPLEGHGDATQQNPEQTQATGGLPLEEEMVDLEELLSEEDPDTVAEGEVPPQLKPYVKGKKGEKGEKGEEGEDDEGEDDDKKKKTDEAIIKENISLKKENEEYRSAVVYLRDRINEVNLLNAKLLYTNKLFKQANLNNAQKLKVIESFDLTKSVREAKLVYATLAESFSFGAKKEVAPAAKKVSTTVKTITEGLASKPVASTKPTKPAVISEGAEMANRFKKLAGIRS